MRVELGVELILGDRDCVSLGVCVCDGLDDVLGVCDMLGVSVTLGLCDTVWLDVSVAEAVTVALGVWLKLDVCDWDGV